jgi:hypothetical protein
VLVLAEAVRGLDIIDCSCRFAVDMDLEDAVLEPDDGMYWDLQRLMLAFFANEQEVWVDIAHDSDNGAIETPHGRAEGNAAGVVGIVCHRGASFIP